MDENASVIAVLNHTWFGSELAPETQEKLANLGSIMSFRPEEVILQEGEEATEMVLAAGAEARREVQGSFPVA